MSAKPAVTTFVITTPHPPPTTGRPRIRRFLLSLGRICSNLVGFPAGNGWLVSPKGRANSKGNRIPKIGRKIQVKGIYVINCPDDTVDGSPILYSPEMSQTPVNHVMSYQPQLVESPDFSTMNSMKPYIYICSYIYEIKKKEILLPSKWLIGFVTFTGLRFSNKNH